jgi:hypothetical protein
MDKGSSFCVKFRQTVQGRNKLYFTAASGRKECQEIFLVAMGVYDVWKIAFDGFADFLQYIPKGIQFFIEHAHVQAAGPQLIRKPSFVEENDGNIQIVIILETAEQVVRHGFGAGPEITGNQMHDLELGGKGVLHGHK